jgi:inner membrane protein
MNAKAGIVTSQVAWLAAIPLVAPDWKAVGLGFAVAGVASYLPDLDHDSSTAGRNLGPLPKILRTVGGGHRMATHSALAVALAYVLATYLVSPHFGLAVAIGWASHIWCDLLTIQGTGLFWPATRRKFHIGYMVTGRRGEEVYIRLTQAVGVLVLLLYVTQFGGVS